MIRLFLGRKEQGKTTLAYHMLAKLPRRMIFDGRGDIRRPGAVIARSVDNFRLAMDALVDGQVSEVVYVPIDDYKTIAFPVFAAEVKRWVIERRDDPIGVLVDEITTVNILEPDFDWAFKSCRAQRMQFFLTCHRPVQVPTDLRFLTDYWYLFQAHQAHDLDALADLSPDVAAAVRGLQRSEYVNWNERTSDRDEQLLIHTDPALWYVELAPGPPLAAPIDLDTVRAEA